MRRSRGSEWLSFAICVALTSSDGTLMMLVPPYLHAEGYDYSTIGFLVAVTYVMALASRLPCGMLYRPDRALALMVGSLVAVGTASVLYPLADGPVMFGLVRVLHGVAIGFATTTNLAMFMDTLPRSSSKARGMGMYAGAMAAGYMVGSVVGGWAVDLLGYTLAYELAGLFALVALGLLLLDRPNLAALSASRPAPVAAGARVLESRLAMFLRPLKAFAEPQLAAVVVVAFALNYLHQIHGTFFPVYGVVIGMSLADVGAIRGMHSLINAIARPLAGPPLARFGHRRVSYIGLALIGSLMALIPALHGFWPLMVLFFVIGGIKAVVLVANTVGIADIDQSRVSRGVAAGLYNAAKDLGNLTSPMIGGAAASMIGLTSMLTMLPGLSVLVFFGLLTAIAARARAAKRLREVDAVNALLPGTNEDGG